MELTQRNDDTVVRFETKEGVCLKALFERLQRFRDCCLEFTERGIFMNATTPSSTTMTILSLDHLDNYYCKAQISMGIEVYNWFKLFKKVNRDDTVVLRIDKDGIDAPVPFASIFIYNSAKQVLVNYRVCFLDIVLEKYEIPDKIFDAVVSVPSIEFLKILRWCESDGTNVRVYTREQFKRTYLVVQTVVSDTSDVCATYVEVMINVTGNTSGPSCNNVDSSNIYVLESLLDIARSGSMNIGGNAILYLTKSQYPLVIDYSVGTMGTIKYCLGPLLTQYTNQNDNAKNVTVTAEQVPDDEEEHKSDEEENEDGGDDVSDDAMVEEDCCMDDGDV